MAVQLLYWFLLWNLWCFYIKDVTCICNVTCTTDYSEHLECSYSGVSPPTSVVLEAECSGYYNGKEMKVRSRCEVRPPGSSCQMRPDNFTKILSTDTECTVVVQDPPTARGVKSSVLYLSEIVKTLPPLNVCVTRTAEAFNITWSVDNYKNICLKYRVRIRGKGTTKSLFVSPLDSPPVRSFVETNQYFLLEASLLLPNTLYQADIQASPCHDFLEGPWSAWSPTVDIKEGGESVLVFYVAIPALLCLIGLCYFSKPFCMKKFRFLMFVPDPSPFFKPLHHKYDGNFKDWVHPLFSEAEVLMVAPPHVPVSIQRLLLQGHHGNQMAEHPIQEDGAYENLCWERGPVDGVPDTFPSHLSLHTVVLSGDESNEGHPELRQADGASALPGEPEGVGMGDGEAGSPAHDGLAEPGVELKPEPNPGGGLLAYACLGSDSDYPALDLDTMDSGFGESDCSSPVCCSPETSSEGGGFFPQEDNAKSNYVQQWMMAQQHPPSTLQRPASPATHSDNKEQ